MVMYYWKIRPVKSQPEEATGHEEDEAEDKAEDEVKVEDTTIVPHSASI